MIQAAIPVFYHFRKETILASENHLQNSCSLPRAPRLLQAPSRILEPTAGTFQSYKGRSVDIPGNANPKLEAGPSYNALAED